jgi:hypothetical protein
MENQSGNDGKRDDTEKPNPEPANQSFVMPTGWPHHTR